MLPCFLFLRTAEKYDITTYALGALEVEIKRLKYE